MRPKRPSRSPTRSSARHGATARGEDPARSWERGRFASPAPARHSPRHRRARRDPRDRDDVGAPRSSQDGRHRRAHGQPHRRRHQADRDVPHLARLSGRAPRCTSPSSRRSRPIRPRSGRRAKDAASRAIGAAGGTITHHHAVGRDHRPYLEAEIGDARRRDPARGEGDRRSARHHEPRRARAARCGALVAEGRMNVTLLVNPAARGGAHTGAATRAAERLRAHGVRTTIISGGSAAESSELLRTAIGARHRRRRRRRRRRHRPPGHPGARRHRHPSGHHPGGDRQRLRRRRSGCASSMSTAAADAIVAGRTRLIDLARVTRVDGTHGVLRLGAGERLRLEASTTARTRCAGRAAGRATTSRS